MLTLAAILAVDMSCLIAFFGLIAMETHSSLAVATQANDAPMGDDTQLRA